MSPTVGLLLIILLIVCCEVTAQSCANYAMHTQNIMYVFIGGLFYLLVVYLLSHAHKRAPMGVVNSIWSGLSIISVTAAGYFIFGQKIATDQAAMMGVIAIAVAYLSIFMEPSPG